MSDWSGSGKRRRSRARRPAPPNHLVSPLNPQIFDQPDTDVFGYYFLPDSRSGDTAKLMGAAADGRTRVPPRFSGERRRRHTFGQPPG